MAGGLFELRRDDITGWWVAVVVDREFERARFALRAAPVPGAEEPCQNCELAPDGDAAWVRVLKPQAFTMPSVEVPARSAPPREASARASGHGREPAREPPFRAGGTGREPSRDAATGSGPSGDGAFHLETAVVEREPSLGLLGDIGSWQAIVAPRRHHAPLAVESPAIVVEMLALARDQIAIARRANDTQYLQVVQNWGAQAGARTNHLCLDFYDLPLIPHRIGEELGGAARYLIREGVCPYCRLVEAEVAGGERLVFEDAASVCVAPVAARSPFELWVVPRHHEADFGNASDAQLTSAAETLRKVLRLLDVLDGPPYNLVLHTAPLHERVDETYHWHWEIHPRLREIAGLELGTGLPVNPVSPEEAVVLLTAGLRTPVGSAIDVDPVPGPRSWDAFRRPGSR
jgi:galactose-1-phosphate uridylyltransferase